jgi:hypothetical protein
MAKKAEKNTNCQSGGACGGAVKPEIAALVAAWPKLPRHIRDAILTLANTTGSKKRRR